MSNRDEELVKKGAVLDTIRLHVYDWITLSKGRMGQFDTYVIDCKKAKEAIDQLPAEKVLDKQRLQNRIRDYLKVRRGWISGTVEEFLTEIFEEEK